MIFVDLEKECYTVARQEMWRRMRETGGSEKFARLIKDIY